MRSLSAFKEKGGISLAFWIFYFAFNLAASECNTLVTESGDVLILRRGHAPKSVQEATTAAMIRASTMHRMSHQSSHWDSCSSLGILQLALWRLGMDKAAIGIYQWLIFMLFQMWFVPLPNHAWLSFLAARPLSVLCNSPLSSHFNGVLQPVNQLVSMASPFLALQTGSMTLRRLQIKLARSICSLAFQSGGFGHLTVGNSGRQQLRRLLSNQRQRPFGMSYASRRSGYGILRGYVFSHIAMVFVLFYLIPRS